MTEELDALIVGGGIAGLTAGLTTARLGRRTLVLTGDALGGHLLSIERIDGYPGFAEHIAGFDLCPIVQEQATAAGAAFAMASVGTLQRTAHAWHATTPQASYWARSVILATGTVLKPLDVPGETLLRGKGVSHCASCDAPLLRDRQVIVAGGGDSAMQEALTLAAHVATVTIVHHGAALSGQAAYRVLVDAHPRIAVRPNSEVREILGQDAVTGARIADLGGEATTSEVECAAVFVYVGLQPCTDFIEDLLPLDATGRIPTDSSMRTVVPGLLAAGTVRSGAAGRAVAAAGDGTTAALAADRYLADGVWPNDD